MDGVIRPTLLTSIFIFGLTSLVPLPGESGARPQARSTVPEERIGRMRRGINISHWFAQVYDDAGYSAEHFNRYITEKDFALIAALGFDHVRFSVEPEPFFNREDPADLPLGYLRLLHETMERILAHDLAIMFDLHPHPRFKRPLRDDDDYLAAVALFWESLASHLARYDPDRVFLELLNEPEIDDPGRWHRVQATLVAAVRRGAPKHTIIATCHNWSGLADLLLLKPLEDRNVVYAFHYYDPGMFTHQGATWGWPPWAKVTNVPYPSDPEAVAPLLSHIDDEEARRGLEQYGKERWNAERIDREIADAAAWARKHGVTVISNEFGVYSKFSPPSHRIRYLRDVREAFERHGIGWTMWDYAGNFGLIKTEDGRSFPDPALVEALGFQLPAKEQNERQCSESSPKIRPVGASSRDPR